MIGSPVALTGLDLLNLRAVDSVSTNGMETRIMRTLLSLSMMMGCATGKGGVVGQTSLLTERPASGGLVEQLIDINGDEQADVFNFYRERSKAARLLVRKEVDLNWDGKVDVRTWFDEDGQIEKEEMDGDFDDRVDWIDHYKGGGRVMSEIDTDYNGSLDLFKYYDNGTLRRKERDTTGDGRIDFWEYIDPNGQVLRTGRDLDADGVMDVRED